MSTVLPTGWLLPARLLLVLSCLLPYVSLAQTPPTFDMAVRVLAPASPGARPYAHDVVVDAAGNSYVSGVYNGSARFDNRTLPAGLANTYIAKIDAAGNYRWIVTIATGVFTTTSIGGSLINSTSLAVDASGNVVVAGNFRNTINLGNTVLISAGGSDLFVGKLDINGNWLSAVRAGGPDHELLSTLALDNSGNAYLTGGFSGTASFGSSNITSVGSSDMFVARLDANGTWRWATRGGGSGTDWGAAVGLDANGHAYVTGKLSPSGGQLGATTLSGGGFIVQLDASTGAYQRVTAFATGTDVMWGRLAVDAAGACYVAGSYLGRITFGGFTLTSIGIGPSNEDVFVAKLDAAGTWQWANTAGGSSGEYCSGIAVDAHGNIYLGGSFRGPGTRFGAITLIPQNAALFFTDVYVAKLDAVGNWLWAVPAGGIQNDVSTDFTLGPFATPYIVGEHFSPTMAFGAIAVPGEPPLAGSTFVARMQPNLLRITGDSLLCSGGTTQLTASTLGTGISWRWNTGATTAGITATQPGTYTVTATFPGGYSLSEAYRVRSIAPTVAITGGAGFLCPGTPRQLTAVAPGATGWRWSTGATTPGITITQPGTYSVVATFSSACTATTQVVVVGNELRINGRLQLCPGSSTTLTAVATGAAATGYLWSTGATTPTLLVGQAGTYRVTASFADGCQLTSTHTVGPPVAKVASVSGDTLLCPGATLILSALNPDALTYRWNTGATTPTIAITQPGTYGVVLTYTGGCTSRDSLRVLAVPLIPAAATLGRDTTLCLEQPLLLHAPAVAGPGVVLRWSDGSRGPTLAVREAGTYSLQISTPCATRTISRRVAYTDCVLIPNVITPNNDQQNDRFVIRNLTSGDWALTLYNRWGRQVYHTSAYHHDWGPDAAAGIYYYQLRQAATNTTYKGWLEVVR